MHDQIHKINCTATNIYVDMIHRSLWSPLYTCTSLPACRPLKLAIRLIMIFTSNYDPTNWIKVVFYKRALLLTARFVFYCTVATLAFLSPSSVGFCGRVIYLCELSSSRQKKRESHDQIVRVERSAACLPDK